MGNVEVCNRCREMFVDTVGMRVCDDCLKRQASPPCRHMLDSDGLVESVQADIDSYARVDGGAYLEAVL